MSEPAATATTAARGFEELRARRADVLAALRGLEAQAEKVGARTLAARLQRELVDKLEADRFHLVVVGEFNHGKTTLVNALLGADALPVGVTPTTALVHHVSYAERPEARVVYADGEEQTIDFAALGRFCVGADGLAASAGGRALRRLDVGYPAPLLRERVVLVDTPGVNDLNLQRAEVTYQYIPQSDAVLFVIDAGQPLKESERVFLQDKLIAGARDKIIFVVAKADIWSPAEREEAMDYIRAELHGLVPAPVLFAVSPLRALGQGPDADAARGGVAELVAHLTSFLAAQRGRIVLDNALGEALAAAGSLGHGIEARRRAARMSTEELGQRIARIEADLGSRSRTLAERRAAVREEAAAIKAWARRDLDRFADDVVRQLPEIVAAASAAELRLHLAGFLEHCFARWAQAETEEIARALEAMADRTVALLREDAHEAARRLSQALGAEVRPPEVQIDTFGYDVGVFALFTVGLGVMFTNVLLGSLLTLAAPVLAVLLKDKVEAETRRQASELGQAAVRQAAVRAAPKLGEMIDESAARLDAWAQVAGQEIHQELCDVLSAARAERARALPDAARAAAECDGLGAELDAVRARLGDLRAALWGAGETATGAGRMDVQPRGPGE